VRRGPRRISSCEGYPADIAWLADSASNRLLYRMHQSIRLSPARSRRSRSGSGCSRRRPALWGSQRRQLDAAAEPRVPVHDERDPDPDARSSPLLGLRQHPAVGHCRGQRLAGYAPNCCMSG
jgi:hypothetical protein